MLTGSERGAAYIDAAIRGEFAKLANTATGRNAALYSTAANLAALGVPDNEIVRVAVNGAQANGYTAKDGNAAAAATIKSGIAAGRASPRAIADGRDKTAPPRERAKAAPPPERTHERGTASQIDLPTRTPPDADGKPHFQPWGEDGPPARSDEQRRHIFRREGHPVRIKIIRDREPRATNWYRVRDGEKMGWQAGKPSTFASVPYIPRDLDPFDRELVDDVIYWPEGEKDADTLARHNLLAFTFGGTGDGLPDGAAEYVRGRHVVITADNDDPGRSHAQKKAAACTGIAASVKIIEFPELPSGGDVSDYLASQSADVLQRRAEQAPIWAPPLVPAAFSSPRNLIIRRASDIDPKATAWLMPGRIACGKQTMIAGEPGKGKSQLGAYLAATVSTGGFWPTEPGVMPTRAPLGSVLILSAEDDPEDTTVPRLIAAGADMSRVHIVSGVQKDGKGRSTFNLAKDMDLLERTARELGDVRLITIDPVSAYLGGGLDSHNNSEVRGALEPVSDMAARLGIAVVTISHFSKNASASAINRVIGSMAFVAAARAAFMVGADPDDDSDTRRLFLPIKNNLAKMGNGLAFRIEQCLIPAKDGAEILASRIAWDGTVVERTADDILSSDVGQDRSARDEAAAFLESMLRDGPKPSRDIEAEARSAGISRASLRRAKSLVGVKAERHATDGDRGMGAGGQWFWRLPDDAAHAP